MGRRTKLLALAQGIKKPQYNELGSWVGGFEVDIATAEGASIMSVQDGTSGEVEGPIVIPAKIHRKVKKAQKAGEELSGELEEQWEELGTEFELEDVAAMVEAGAKADVAYYRLSGSDELVFGTDADKLSDDWRGSLVDGVGEWDSWDDMETDELEQRLEGFGLTVDDEGDDEEDDGEDGE